MRQRELLKIGPSALQTFPPLHAPHNSARPMAGDTQRSSSYNERSTLPSYGTSTPPSWKGSAAARHLHQPSATSLRQNVWTVLRFRSSIAHSSGLQFASYVLELFVLALILANVLVALTMSTSVIGGDATTGACGWVGGWCGKARLSHNGHDALLVPQERQTTGTPRFCSCRL